MGSKGLIASTAGLAPLLLAGIGDTIRVSLTPKPSGDRTEEVQAAQQILQSLSIRSFMPQVTSCPGCGRTTSTYFQELAEQIQSYLRTSMPEWRKKYPGVEELKLAVMGCVVNGPGESKHANLGISLPGTFEEPKAPVYVDGKLYTTLRGDTIVAEFKQILDNYVESHYGKSADLVGTSNSRYGARNGLTIVKLSIVWPCCISSVSLLSWTRVSLYTKCRNNLSTHPNGRPCDSNRCFGYNDWQDRRCSVCEGNLRPRDVTEAGSRRRSKVQIQALSSERQGS